MLALEGTLDFTLMKIHVAESRFNSENMRTLKNLTRLISCLALLLTFALLVPFAYAGEPVIWETNSRAEILKGEARGVSITDTGVFMLAPRMTQLFNTDQAYIWSSATDAAGNVYLGTGHDGRIYRVSPDGRGTVFHDAAELDVTAMAVGRDGALYAGTSPDGKVYRLSADGRAEMYFDPPDKYIWSLAVLADGQLIVGTGDNGKLYRVRSAGAKPEESLLVDTNETHVISLAVDAQGNLIAGTDPGGLILRVSPDGKVFALYDAPLREIHALAPAPDGSIYALALSDGASATRSSSAPVTTTSSDSSGTTSTTVTITQVDESGTPLQSQPSGGRSRNDLSSARSAVFRLLPDGGTDVVWSSQTITAFAIAPAPQGGGVLIGTADKGRIYSVMNDGRDTLLLQSNEGQISSFAVRGREVYAASSNQGKLFRFGSELTSEGTYESPVRDAKLFATWGRIWWRGRGAVELQTRSGNNERPDLTWSDWSAPYRDPSGGQINSPRARFIQWRAVLRSSTNSAGGGEAQLEDVNLAYLPRNVAPEILSISTLPTGVGLQQLVQMQIDPNVESSGLDPSLFGATATIMPRRLYQRGARSLQWQAEDRNGDTLEYSIYYRSLNENSFRLLKDKLRENFYTVDGAALADGRYFFKIIASDAPGNAMGQSLAGERTSEAIEIDNTPPVVRSEGEARVEGDRARAIIEVFDSTGMVKHADFSINGSDWRTISPDDGIADSPRERFTLNLPLEGAGEHTISLRAFDSSGNVGSIRIIVRR